MGEPDGLPSMGSHRVGHDWSDLAAAAAACMVKRYPFYICTIWLLLLNCFLSFIFVTFLKELAHKLHKLLSEFGNVAKSLQSCLTLCDPIDGSPSGSPVPGILQARTLEWVAISFSNAWKWKGKVTSLSHVWLSNPIDCSLPGSSIHGIFQARALEWVAIAFSGIW